ncbi:NAD(P)H-binding protein [Flavobacterium plurextorum]|uniref:NAD(P)H-binding protein n=1 Tax=Flavobacterium TaxID=237 RepID=UPI00214DC479|nr:MULTISPECIES: NAD(P)H-binding protein [Flavobacterium]UUW08728.1 NAD(P)H-binding protein [Flavobacterium plurextorum]
MKNIKIAIAGAAGNIGSRVAAKISAAGASAVLIGQNEERLKKLNVPNSITAVADLGNTSEMIAATKDADALFLLVPPLITVPDLKGWYKKVTAAGIAAVNENHIKKVVLVSSLGVNLDETSGSLAYAAEMEIAFDKLDADVLCLRPGYFMENLLTQIQLMQTQKQFSFLFKPDFEIPFISTDDIGDAAARYLLDTKWAGHWKLNLMGPESITCEQVAARLSAVLPHAVTYQQGSVEQSKAMLAHFGASSGVQQELTDMFQTLASRKGPYASPRTPESHTPASLEQFAKLKLLPLM